jgi:hypothetical protein
VVTTFRCRSAAAISLELELSRVHTVVVDLKGLYLFEHAHVHSASVARSDAVNLEDLLYDNVAATVYRACPDEHANSMLWLLWHSARSEDVAINLVLSDGGQVFDDRWAERMGVDATDIGTGMTFEDVCLISRTADLDAIRSYRREVGLRTREVVGALELPELDRAVLPDRLDRVTEQGCLREQAAWVVDFWRPQRAVFFLWLGTGHSYMHLQEASVTRSRAGAGLGM